jgi:YD repeat-containing protein
MKDRHTIQIASSRFSGMARLVLLLGCMGAVNPRAPDHAALNAARSAWRKIQRMENQDERRIHTDHLTRFLKGQLPQHADNPELVALLRFVLIEVQLEAIGRAQAQETAEHLVSEYRATCTKPEFDLWLSNRLGEFRNAHRDTMVVILATAAQRLGIEIPAPRNIENSDYDGDGIEVNKDLCRGYDDRKDSDADGVPDGCEDCWGFPDSADADSDGIPDGCDQCPGEVDSDGDIDEVPDGCDSCPSIYNTMVPRPQHDRLYDVRCICDHAPFPQCCWQPDEDGDTLGDPCDFSREMKPVAVRDGAGRLLESFEYKEFGKPSLRVRWDGERSIMMVTTYEYNQYREMVSLTEQPLDGSAPPQTTKIFRDDRQRIIGLITDGRSEGERFTYYDDKNQVIMITTAHDPPEDATILERFERDKLGNVLKHERLISETNALEVVETRSHVTYDDGSYEIVVRKRLDQNSEGLIIEGYGPHAGRMSWLKEYAEPVSPRGAQPASLPLVTRFEYHTEEHPGGPSISDWTVTIAPSGERHVQGWKLYGEPYQAGSYKVFEEYVTDVQDPTDSQKRDWTMRRAAFFNHGSYEVTESRAPDGTLTLYERDPEDPQRIVREDNRPSRGIGDSDVARTYDDAGRVVEEVATTDGQRVVSGYDYDHQGRRIRQSRSDALGSVDRHHDYDAFDRLRSSFSIVQGADFALALPDWSISVLPGPDVFLQASGFGSGVADWDGESAERASLIVHRKPVDAERDAAEPLERAGEHLLRAFLDESAVTANGPLRSEQTKLTPTVQAWLHDQAFDGTTALPSGRIMQLCARDESSLWTLRMVILRDEDQSHAAAGRRQHQLLKYYLTTFRPGRQALEANGIRAHLETILAD